VQKAETAPAAAPARGRLPATIAEWAGVLATLLFATTSLLQAFVVPTGSMESTILVGDHLFVDKLAYAPAGAAGRRLLPYSDVKRGDIIVLRWPPDIKQTYVKRVIGVPGDRVRIVAKQVWVNGVIRDEPYVQHIMPGNLAYRDYFPAAPEGPVYPGALEMLKHVDAGDLIVPPGNYFALGDNRDDSLDSRYWGFVPRANIIGKPLIIFWSYDAPTEHLADPNPVNVDHVVDLFQNFFTKTRWRRTFKLVRAAE
jgi:signal peptidase I